MLLVEFTINSVLNRLSDVGYDLTNNWKGKIQSIDPVQYQMAQHFGGYVRLGYGGISFVPDLFDDDWPPPINGAISVYYSNTTEEAKTELFSGIAHLADINRERITYDLYGPEYDETVAGATAYNDTLNNVLGTILTGIAEIDTLDTTYARAVSPNVAHTTSGVQLSIELASAIAAFYTHCFYISGSTAYLIDMLLDAGSTTITEFDYFPAQYDYREPMAAARAGSFARFSSYPYGGELSLTQYHDTEANVNTCLDNILTVYHKPFARLPMPLVSTSLATPGKKISWPDTALGQDTDVWTRARTIQYDFNNEEVVSEGEGAIAAG